MKPPNSYRLALRDSATVQRRLPPIAHDASCVLSPTGSHHWLLEEQGTGYTKGTLQRRGRCKWCHQVKVFTEFVYAYPQYKNTSPWLVMEDEEA